MTSDLLTQFDQAVEREQRLHQIFRGSLLGKLRHYPWRALVSKIIFRFIPQLQSYWIVKNTLFTGQTFYTEGYFMDYYLCGIIGEENERALTRWLLQNITTTEVFLDIGAHYGFYSLVMEALNKNSGSIYSFEPTPTTRKVLLKNTSSYPSITVIDKAVVDQSGQRELNIYASGGKRGSNSFYAEDALAITDSEEKLATLSVPTTTIDEFCSQNGLQPTIIKLDIENAELDALRGGVETLKKYKPKIAMEVWPSPNNSKHKQAAMLLQDLGYKLYLLDQAGQKQPIIDIEQWFATANKTENLIALSI